MNDIYYYETIEECEKDIVDKAINLDIAYSSCCNLFECFMRTVRTLMIWAMIGITIFTFINKGFKSSISIFGWLLLIYAIGWLLMEWVKFNHNRSYNAAKVTMVDNMIIKCKQYKETDYEEWQKKQVLKRFASLANINVDLDNAK